MVKPYLASRGMESQTNTLEPTSRAKEMVEYVKQRVKARQLELLKKQEQDSIFVSDKVISKAMESNVHGLEAHLSRMKQSRLVRGNQKVLDEWSHQEGTRAQLLDFHSKKGHIVV